jgi:hypothetical protein
MLATTGLDSPLILNTRFRPNLLKDTPETENWNSLLSKLNKILWTISLHNKIHPQKLSLTVLRIVKYAQLFWWVITWYLRQSYSYVDKSSNKRNELFVGFVDLWSEVKVKLVGARMDEWVQYCKALRSTGC